MFKNVSINGKDDIAIVENAHDSVEVRPLGAITFLTSWFASCIYFSCFAEEVEIIVPKGCKVTIHDVEGREIERYELVEGGVK